ncbi:MAG TPA: triose-phosphate isomerase [Azospira sp.]|nr:triose-phosphate isomerase [Azospira sp.]
MRQKLVAGNWKMYGSLAANQALLEEVAAGVGELSDVGVAVCVPFPYLAQAQQCLAGSPVVWGAQNLSEYESGAYTGEVAGSMLKEFGCQYVIVGHSERRALFGDGDERVAEKVGRALSCGLLPILCVGETLEEREAGRTVAVVVRQLAVVLHKIGVAAFAQVVVAYEPVWAIGTGKTASAAQAQEVHAAIRAEIAAEDVVVAEKVKILYGGSVKPGNAAELFAMPDIDGGLIGGAALVAQDFLAICRAAAR